MFSKTDIRTSMKQGSSEALTILRIRSLSWYRGEVTVHVKSVGQIVRKTASIQTVHKSRPSVYAFFIQSNAFTESKIHRFSIKIIS